MIFNMISGGGGDTNVVIIASSDESKGTVGGITKFVYTKKAVAQTFRLSSTFNPTTGYILNTLTTSVGSIAKVADEWILTVPADTEGEITVTAEFAVAYKITVQSADSAKGTVGGTTVYYYGSGVVNTIDLTETTFTFASGYCFDKYTTSVGTIGGTNNKVLTIPASASGDFTVTANFINNQFFKLTPASGYVSVSINNACWDATKREYSIDEGHTWNSSDGVTFTAEGNTIMARGIGATRVSYNGTYAYSWTITGIDVSCTGNIETLLDYVVVDSGSHPTMGTHCFERMFLSDHIVSAPELPATTLADYCYKEMFQSTKLVNPPLLPATSLVPHCYENMFSGCTTLTTAPNLPATTLAESCYYRMFSSCVALTTAPVLNATALEPNCYKEMFWNCIHLNYIEVGFDTWTDGTTTDWVKNVADTGTFKCPMALPETTGYSNIPVGWVVQKPSYNITVSSADTSKGTVSGTTVFTYAPSTSVQTVTLTTTFNPATDYEVDVLTPSIGSVAKVGSDYVLTIPANTTGAISVVTSWKLITYTITVSSGDTSKGTIGGTTTYTYIRKNTSQFIPLSITILPESGYELDTFVCNIGTISSAGGLSTLNIPANATGDITAVATWKVLGATVNVNLKRDGVAQAGEIVSASCTGQTTQTKTTDASGNCTFTGLPNGTWTFSTSNASYVCDSVTQTTVAGQTYNINLTQSTVALKVNVKKFGVAEANATVVLKQGSTTIGTKTTDASGDCQFGSLSPSTAYTVEATCVTTPVFSTSTSVTTGASGLTTLNLGLGNRVGGRIFYVDTTSTGGTYTFYKQDGSQITTSATPTVAELADAYYYSVSGTPSKDMFYVYDNTNGLITNKEWGARGTSVGVTSDGIGVGKTNSATCLANSACFTPYTSGNTTIWKWLRDEINANNIGGCNDWFIASTAEQDKLSASGIVTWYSSNYIWSSVEYDSTYAWRWYGSLSGWSSDYKNSTRCVFASRAF